LLVLGKEGTGAAVGVHKKGGAEFLVRKGRKGWFVGGGRAAA